MSARVALGVAVVASGVGALQVAQGPGQLTTYAGHSDLAATLTFLTGAGLVLAGLALSFSGPSERIGDLTQLAGLVWLAPVWVGWNQGPSLVRSIGMVAAGFTVPLLIHVVLAFPGGRVQTLLGRAVVAGAYLGALLAALGRGLFYDPFLDPYCWANCTGNVFLVRSLPDLADRDRSDGSVAHGGRYGHVGCAVRVAAGDGLGTGTPCPAARRAACRSVRCLRRCARGGGREHPARGSF